MILDFPICTLNNFGQLAKHNQRGQARNRYDPSAYARILFNNASGVDAHFGGEVTCEEIAWMLRFRPLHPPPDLTQLSLDYSERQGKLMLHSFERCGATHLLGVLNWAGVGSRWEIFLRFISANSKDFRC
jgi:hypothetical protein